MHVEYPGRTSCGCPYLNQPDAVKHWSTCSYRLNTEASSRREETSAGPELIPCPFCHGEATALVLLNSPAGGRVDRQDTYGCDGADVVALVQCTHCEAKGPEHVDVLFCADGFDEAVRAAIRLWSVRDQRGAG